MGLLEGRKKIKKWRSGWKQSVSSGSLTAFIVCSRSAFSLAAGILSSCSSSLPGASRQPAQAQKAMCGTESLRNGCAGRALCWIWTLWGWKKLVFSRDSSTGLLTCGRVTFHFPSCWEITWFFLKWITSLNPRFSSRNMGTILFSTFLPTLNMLRLNCRFSVILPSQVKARKEIRSIPPARTLAHLLLCGPQVGTHLCFRDVC